MIFPRRGCVWEHVADHLDHLPRKSLINGLVHHRRMANDDDTAGTDEPGNGSKGRRDKTDGDGDNIKTSVQLRGGGAHGAELEIAAIKLADEEHAGDHKDDIEKQPPVGQQSVDAEHDEDDGVVAGEVAEVVVDAGLHVGKVLGLGQALDIEELGQRTQVREARGQRGRPDAVEAVSQLEARRQHVDRDLDAGGHCGGLVTKSDEEKRRGKRKRRRREEEKSGGGRSKGFYSGLVGSSGDDADADAGAGASVLFVRWASGGWMVGLGKGGRRVGY